MSEKIEILQRSEEWFKIRKGKITSSEVHKIMGGKEDALTDTAKTYILEKVSESLGGFQTQVVGAALDWGTDIEDLAIQVYEERTGLAVKKSPYLPYDEHYGGSPDGIVQPNGVIEVKCPYVSTNHFKHGMIKSAADFKKVATNYYYQCISNMLCSNAEWCDFISYDPRVDDAYAMFIYRLTRDEAEIDLIKAKLKVAVEYKNKILATIQGPTITDSSYLLEHDKQ